MTSTNLLKIENATVKYRDQTLFTGLNFKIEKNEHWAIVGESGTGKSALLQTLAGRHFISEGKRIHTYYEQFKADHPVSDPYFSHHSLVSYVDTRHDFKTLSNTGNFYYQQRFNAGYSDNALTAEDFFKKKAGSPASEKKWNLIQIYNTFDLTPLLKKHLIKLSNGESKRLRIGAALLNDPRLLFLDTPLAGLDVRTRERFESIFSEIAKSGISIVMVTSPLEIPKVITHVAELTHPRKLNTYKKQDFNPGQNKAAPLTISDADKLQTLMARKDKPHFDVLVDMRNVRVAYGDAVIFDRISWKIRQGERWALSGPNGSGKSTLLSLINGDHPQAYANEIVLFDKKRGTGDSIWDFKKRIGFMSQELYQYFPFHYSCQQVVESGFYDTIGLFTDSQNENREIAEQWMAIMGLSSVKTVALAEVSESQQRLCLLARAIVKNPHLLLLDEPCLGFDRPRQQTFRNLIDAIAKGSDLSIVYVTHHQEELPSCITKTITLG